MAHYFTFLYLVITIIMVTITVVSSGTKPFRWKSFSIKDKRELVQAIDIMVSTSISHCQACSWVGLHHIYYTCFKKVIEKVDALKKIDVYVPYKTNGTARKTHPWHPSWLSIIKDDLACFIVHARHSGIQVSTHMICQEPCHLLLFFRDKLPEAKRMGLSHGAATHTTQKHYKETEEELKHFINFMRAKLAGRDPRDIINMDQTPILYSFHSIKMLKNKDTRSIHVHASTTDTKCITLAVALDGSRSMLPHMLILKNAPNR